MKFKKLCKMTAEGFVDACELGLNREDSWDPIMVYLHTSRIIIGAILGFVLGVCVTAAFFIW